MDVRKIVICSLLTFGRFEKTAKEVRKYYLVFEKKWKPPAEAPRIEQRIVECEAKRNKRNNLEPS
ncbi:hypothetical protein PILCRDRAFT_829853, partial [Piloderma croceum F 1598]